MQPEMTGAVVEIGAGSVKLLVTQSTDAGLTDRVNRSLKTNLLKCKTAGALSAQGFEATEAALVSFAAELGDFEIDALSVVATSVARDVADLSVLEMSCRRHFDCDVEVLSGQREAELGWRGATSGRDLSTPVVVLDVGSGSTELALATPPASTGITTFSMPIGARTVTADFLHGDPPGPEELSAALSVIELHYDDVKREAPEFVTALEDGLLLGVGAACQIARVEIGLDDQDTTVDGHQLTKAEVEEVFRALATESRQDRAHNPGLAPGHVSDIVGGLCILVEFLRRFPADRLTISERDLRHGRAQELFAGLNGGGLGY